MWLSIALILIPSATLAGPIIPAIASAAIASFSGAAFLGLTGFAAFAARVAVGMLLGFAERALAPKPKRQQNSQQVSGNTFVVRQPDATRKLVYGQTRIGDIYAKVATTDESNKYLHLFIILASNECADIGEVWADDYCIPPDHLDSDGNVTEGLYEGVMRIRKHLGSPTQTADERAVAEIPGFTTSSRLQGIAYLYVRLQFNQETFPVGQPNITAIVKGKPVFDPRTRTTGFSSNAILFAYDYLKDIDYGFGAKDRNVSDDNFGTEATIADEIVTVTNKDMVVSEVTAATDLITLDDERLKFEIGDRVVLLTSGVAPAGLATSTNYYVIPYQFKTTPRIKLATSLANAMSGTAIDITDAGSGTHTIRKTGEPRYHGAGIIDTGNTLGDNLQSMLSAAAARIVPIAGKWRIVCGAYRTPEVTLDEGDLRGSLSYTPRISMADRFNSVSGLYVSSLNDYQPSDYPAVTNDDLVDDDGGYPLPYQLNQPICNRPDACQRIGTIELLKARQEITVELGASLKAMQVQPGQNIYFTYSKNGWASKIFEVTRFALSISVDSGRPTVLTQLTLRETAEEVYTWTADMASGYDPAPNTLLPDPYTVGGVSGLAFSSRAVDTQGGDVLFVMQLSWNAPQDYFVLNNGHFDIDFSLAGAEAWQPSLPVRGDQTSADILTSSVNVAYDLRIQAVNNLGVPSGYTYLRDCVVGSSGGVGTTKNWQTYQDTVGSSEDWQTYQDMVGTTDDWGSYV